MLKRQIGLGASILGANVRTPGLPYKVTFVATYHCNFRCEMCNIWQKKSVNEMTPQEISLFFERWPQFKWVQLTGGELMMRRDIDDVVAAIQKSCKSLYLLSFPTTGWFGDKTLKLVENTLTRGIGRLMVTISIDGPKAMHEEMRGLPGAWDKGIETFRRLRALNGAHFQTVIGMTLLGKNAGLVDETIEAIRKVIPDFDRRELHLNIGHESGHYYDNKGVSSKMAPNHEAVAQAIEEHRRAIGTGIHPVDFLEHRYQSLVRTYYETSRSPLPCTALKTSCFIDPYWNVFACSIWDAQIGNLRDNGFDLQALWDSPTRKSLRQDVIEESCPHCWTPCEAYPTILGNLLRAVKPAAPQQPPLPVEAAR
jgi:MoaA/NifB/PqqE/SkfB family radical SAM enzyme